MKLSLCIVKTDTHSFVLRVSSDVKLGIELSGAERLKGGAQGVKPPSFIGES